MLFRMSFATNVRGQRAGHSIHLCSLDEVEHDSRQEKILMAEMFDVSVLIRFSKYSSLFFSEQEMVLRTSRVEACWDARKAGKDVD